VLRCRHAVLALHEQIQRDGPCKLSRNIIRIEDGFLAKPSGCRLDWTGAQLNLRW